MSRSALGRASVTAEGASRYVTGCGLFRARVTDRKYVCGVASTTTGPRSP